MSDTQTKLAHEQSHPGQVVTWNIEKTNDPDPGAGQGPSHVECHVCSVCGSMLAYTKPGAAPEE